MGAPGPADPAQIRGATFIRTDPGAPAGGASRRLPEPGLEAAERAETPRRRPRGPRPLRLPAGPDHRLHAAAAAHRPRRRGGPLLVRRGPRRRALVPAGRVDLRAGWGDRRLRTAGRGPQPHDPAEDGPQPP